MERKQGIYERYVKRILDIVCALAALIVFCWLYAILAILVRIKLGSPVLFTQPRPGKDEKIFKLYKFRSMTNEKDAQGQYLPEEQRMTKFGKLLRSSSLDELPELFLILKGDMSFIGPRPQPGFYAPYYHENEKVIFTVRGGLIPPDCLCGQPQCSWETQFEYEMYYARHVSFLLDLKILAYAFLILVRRLKHSYGADDRPMLNVYRADMVKEKEHDVP